MKTKYSSLGTELRTTRLMRKYSRVRGMCSLKASQEEEAGSRMLASLPKLPEVSSPQKGDQKTSLSPNSYVEMGQQEWLSQSQTSSLWLASPCEGFRKQ